MLTESTSAYKYNVSTRGILGGLFVGIGAAVINLVFDIIYRKVTGYEFSEYININSIIFFTIPTLIVAGIVYSLMLQFVKRGMMVYIVVSVILTIIVAFIPLGPNMLPTGQAMPPSARGLTLGVELITGLMGAFALPYFAEHPAIWGD
ncbi:MAG: hypothetical protein JO301_04185 [Chitinophagaceae bacterium]|nr:hypothetical protein [Chitinophagaceae bacterium]